MVVWDSLLITFGMYTVIPVPQKSWTERGMRWTMAWFPLIGLIVGGGWLFILWLNSLLLMPVIYIASALMVLWPIILSGGLHIDGLADSADALGSRRDRQTKLRIMKDPTSGPSAILWTVGVLLMQLMAWLEIARVDLFAYPGRLIITLLIPVISRILAGIGVSSLPSARSDGLVKTFRDGLAPAVLPLLITAAIIIAAACLLLDLVGGIAIIITAIVCFICWLRMCIRGFGGVTGDLAGFLLAVSETAMLVVIAVMTNGFMG